jgi:hypothetical protein
VVVGVIILGSEEPSNDQRCGATGRHSVRGCRLTLKP